MPLVFFIISLLELTTAPPNPVTDNQSDQSNEKNSYKYPDFEKIDAEPYWKAFPEETRFKLREHDRLELNVLGRIRSLDFKLREAWTRTDKPFVASH